MSYILDALKRSEAERRAGAAPGPAPGTVYVVAPGSHAGLGGAAVLAGAGMLVAGLALGAWHPWQAAKPAGVVLAAAPPLPIQRGDAIPVPPVAASSPALPRSPVMSAKVSTVTKSAASVRAGAEGAKLPAKVASPLAKAVQAAPAERILAYQELPADIRSGLPKITFGGYAGTDESEVRIAFINDRLVKEGEEVSPGVKLEQVSREGVVMAYQGYRFRPTP
ncbi:MAG: hypothetical protein H6R10_3578 [Rhodocyclaceae bacterium]|nr:hypothetical protein [Rhodocyclaceae bacterium]